MLLMTAIFPSKELRACKTITNSSSIMSGVISVCKRRNSSPRDAMLRNSIRSLYSFAAPAYASLTAKYVKAVKFIRKHADLPFSETGGKYMSMLRSLSKSTDDFWTVRDKSKHQNRLLLLYGLFARSRFVPVLFHFFRPVVNHHHSKRCE